MTNNPSLQRLPAPLLTQQGTAQTLRILGKERNDAAWTWIVEQEGPTMFGVAMRILGNAAAADDACQEAFLHVRNGAHRFVPPESGDADAAARAWLLRVVTNAAAMWSRTERRRAEREQRVAKAIPLVSGSPPSASKESEALQCALRELPDAQRVPVVLHHLAGQDYQSIGHVLGISSGAARVRVHRALVLLRDHMARLGITATALTVMNHLSSAEVLMPATAPARWHALLTSPLTPVAPTASIFGGLTIMTKIAIVCCALTVSGLISVTALPSQAQETTTSSTPTDASTDSHPTTTRVTITGLAKTLVDHPGKFDASAEYASVTTTESTTSGQTIHTTYLVLGGAGYILALRAGGQTVTVTGILGERHGEKTISGRSIDVAIDGAPIENMKP